VKGDTGGQAEPGGEPDAKQDPPQQIPATVDAEERSDNPDDQGRLEALA
jgi:hypothetical protein